MPRIPRYCDAFIDAFDAGLCGDHLHLGYWDIPPPLDRVPAPGEFAAAQVRLTQRLIALFDLAPSTRILDVACGLGGTLREIDALFQNVDMTGLNLDWRQIALCRRLTPTAMNRLRWVVGDAGALPFAASSFDAVTCIEAMFHFDSRARFLAEVGRILKPGGQLVVSDILLFRTEPNASHAIRALERDYGPWPEPWITKVELVDAAAKHGLACDAWIDATRTTMPSYRTIAPTLPSAAERWSGSQAMRAMQSKGHLRYVLARFSKRSNGASPDV